MVSMTTKHADSLSESGTNSPPMKNLGSEIKHTGGKSVKEFQSHVSQLTRSGDLLCDLYICGLWLTFGYCSKRTTLRYDCL